jgi:DNA polymerase-3 subunit alpha
MKIFDLMEKFAGYGFNKSHSAAYALVSYQTAWLKRTSRRSSWRR